MSLYPACEASGSENHHGYGYWNQIPQTLSTWTLWVSGGIFGRPNATSATPTWVSVNMSGELRRHGPLKKQLSDRTMTGDLGRIRCHFNMALLSVCLTDKSSSGSSNVVPVHVFVFGMVFLTLNIQGASKTRFKVPKHYLLRNPKHCGLWASGCPGLWSPMNPTRNYVRRFSQGLR